MKKVVLLISLLALCMATCLAQSNSLQGKHTIKVGYDFTKSHDGILYSSEGLPRDGYPSQGSFSASWSYGITSCWNLGVYVGVKNTLAFLVREDKSLSEFVSPKYGITADFHIMPLVNADCKRIDAYLTGNIGGVWCVSNYTEYGVGAGIAFYPIKQLGIYGEAHWGNYQLFKLTTSTSSIRTETDFQLSVGIALRL